MKVGIFPFLKRGAHSGEISSNVSCRSSGDDDKRNYPCGFCSWRDRSPSMNAVL